MPLIAFDHVNIRTNNVAGLTAFYRDVMGLTEGFRPEFSVPGAWIYLGDTCVIHLIEADPDPTPYAEGESLRLEHVSFRATGMADFLATLDAHGVTHKVIAFDEIDSALVFFRDPDGNRFHVDFPMSEMPD